MRPNEFANLRAPRQNLSSEAYSDTRRQAVGFAGPESPSASEIEIRRQATETLIFLYEVAVSTAYQATHLESQTILPIQYPPGRTLRHPACDLPASWP
jgi:hypothetical protein